MTCEIAKARRVFAGACDQAVIEHDDRRSRRIERARRWKHRDSAKLDVVLPPTERGGRKRAAGGGDEKGLHTVKKRPPPPGMGGGGSKVCQGSVSVPDSGSAKLLEVALSRFETLEPVKHLLEQRDGLGVVLRVHGIERL